METWLYSSSRNMERKDGHCWDWDYITFSISIEFKFTFKQINLRRLIFKFSYLFLSLIYKDLQISTILRFVQLYKNIFIFFFEDFQDAIHQNWFSYHWISLMDISRIDFESFIRKSL